MATTREKITRSKAIEIITGLRAGKIFGVTFVTRGEGHSGPQLRTMSCAKGVTRHLRGGQQPYVPSEHGLMTVYEMLSPEAALADYRSQASAAIRGIDERHSKTQAALAQARTKLSLKNTKANRTSVENKERALQQLAADRKFEEQKLGPDYVLALRAELEARIQRRQAEADALGKRDLNAPGAYEKYEEALAAVERAKGDLLDPEETLRIRYRNINLAGLTRLAVDNVEYEITTAPRPQGRTCS